MARRTVDFRYHDNGEDTDVTLWLRTGRAKFLPRRSLRVLLRLAEVVRNMARQNRLSVSVYAKGWLAEDVQAQTRIPALVADGERR